MNIAARSINVFNYIYPVYLRCRNIPSRTKSAAVSAAHTDSFCSLQAARNTRLRIHADTDVRVSGAGLRLGYNNGPLGNVGDSTKLRTGSDAVLEISTTNQPARIRRGASLNIDGHFQIGESYINSGAEIFCHESIQIGDGCAISWGVTMFDTTVHEVTIDDNQQPTTSPVLIEDDVWIGHDASIKKDVSIGEGAIVASDSVVTNDVPPRTMVAGAPAKVKRKNVDWK